MRFTIEIDLNNEIFKQGTGKGTLCQILDEISESIFVHNVDNLAPENKPVKHGANQTVVGYYSIIEEPIDKAKINGDRFYVQQVEDDPEYFHLMDRINGDVVDVGSESDMEDQAKELNQELNEAWETNKRG